MEIEGMELSQIIMMKASDLRDLLIDHLEQTGRLSFEVDRAASRLHISDKHDSAWINLIALDRAQSPHALPPTPDVVFFEAAKARFALREESGGSKL